MERTRNNICCKHLKKKGKSKSNHIFDDDDVMFFMRVGINHDKTAELGEYHIKWIYFGFPPPRVG